MELKTPLQQISDMVDTGSSITDIDPETMASLERRPGGGGRGGRGGRSFNHFKLLKSYIAKVKFLGKEQFCPKWGQWDNVTCWWPSMSWDSLPKSCTNVPGLQRWPVWFQDVRSHSTQLLYSTSFFAVCQEQASREVFLLGS